MFCKHIIVILSCVTVCIWSRPNDSSPEKQQPTVIPIVSQSDELEPNGTYKFSYETGNGIKREEIAYDKVLPSSKSTSKNHDSSNEGGEDNDDSNEIHVQKGSYSYTAPDGTVITVRYIADENGFQPIGDHIPRVPVASSSSNSAEKAGRSLTTADSTKSDLSPVKTKTNEKPFEVKPATPASITSIPSIPAPKIIKNASSTTAKPVTEANESTTANVDVSTNAASTAAPNQTSTETEQASTASAEQASTSAPEQSVTTEDSESLSSTSAPEQSSSSEALGQSTTSEPLDQTTAEETEQQSTTTQSTSAEESSSTTTSA